MNLDVLQIGLGIVTFVSFIMAARSGLPTADIKPPKQVLAGETEFITREDSRES